MLEVTQYRAGEDNPLPHCFRLYVTIMMLSSSNPLT